MIGGADTATPSSQHRLSVLTFAPYLDAGQRRGDGDNAAPSKAWLNLLGLTACFRLARAGGESARFAKMKAWFIDDCRVPFRQIRRDCWRRPPSLTSRPLRRSWGARQATAEYDRLHRAHHVPTPHASFMAIIVA